jgi:pimeloyl-ACP methyl ester carboxylesterase
MKKKKRKKKLFGIETINQSSFILLEKNFSLIGGSLGGALAVHFSATFPSVVENLILLAPTGFPVAKQNYGRNVLCLCVCDCVLFNLFIVLFFFMLIFYFILILICSFLCYFLIY